MIKINLLRNSGLASAAGGAQGKGAEGISTAEMQRTAAIRLITILLMPVGLYVFERANLSNATDELAQTQQTVTDLNNERAKFGDISPRVEKYNKEKQKVDQRLEVIRGISKNRLREVKTLDALQTTIPDGSWLHLIRMEGPAVELEGFANGEEKLTQIIRALESSTYFSQVEPRQISQDTVRGMRVIKFKIDLQAGKSE